MALITKKVVQKWNGRTKPHYVEKGYIFTKIYDEFIVDIEDLTKGSQVKVDVLCDYCEEKISISYKTYLSQKEKRQVKKDCCKKCSSKKVEESMIAIHGVKNTMHLEEYKNKQKKAIKDKYGVDNISQLEGIQEKKNKTSLKKYGKSHYSKTNEFKERTEKTCLEKFGYDSAMKSPVIAEKARNTLFENGTAPVSKQQKHIHSIIKGELNYPFGRSSLDIAFPKEKIYFEYDGGGHNLDVKIGKITQDDFDKKEQKRYFHLLDSGWKCIRMITPDDKLPTDEEIKSFMEGCYLDFEKDSSLCSIRWNTKENKIKKNYKRV